MARKRKVKGGSWNPQQSFSERERDGGKLLTRAEVAQVLGTNERHVRRMVERGELPKVKVGPKVRVHIDDVEAYIEAQRVTAERRPAAKVRIKAEK